MPGFKALIPLDGTNHAEAALQLGPYLKSVGCTTIRLVAVWEALNEFSDGSNPELRLAIEEGPTVLQSYLDSKARDLRALGLDVIAVVHMGAAADWILADAEEHDVDIVVLATHGRAGSARWRLGSVADKVIRGSECPVLVIGPNVLVDMRTLAGRRIVVPLDGSDFAEEALPVARKMAEKLGCRLELVRVVSLPNSWVASPYMTFDPTVMLNALDESAKAYLDRVLPEVACRRTVIRSLMPGNVAGELTNYARTNGAGVVVMTSHAHAGAVRWLLGSVADEVLRGTTPVLLVTPGCSKAGELFSRNGQAQPTQTAV